MNSEARKYLHELNLNLSDLSEEDKQEILLEIKNHIFEATKNGGDTMQILDRMGSPSTLAQAYSLSYQTEQRKLKPMDILKNFSFYASAGLTGTVVISFFGFLTAVFLIIAIAIPGMAITNLIGFTHIPMFVWGSASIPPGMLQLILGAAVGTAFVWLAYLCWIEIKKCVGKISLDYRNFKLDN